MSWWERGEEMLDFNLTWPPENPTATTPRSVLEARNLGWISGAADMVAGDLFVFGRKKRRRGKGKR